MDKHIVKLELRRLLTDIKRWVYLSRVAPTLLVFDALWTLGPVIDVCLWCMIVLWLVRQMFFTYEAFIH